jgi:hypothetical protein
VGGRKILYVITLRPLWFRACTPEQRVSTILHELWHASERFDGTLHRGRVHARLPRARYERRVRALRDRYLLVAPEEILAPFTFSGVALARMWLEGPAGFYRLGEYGGRRTYTERQLYLGLVRMKTPSPGRLARRRPRR